MIVVMKAGLAPGSAEVARVTHVAAQHPGVTTDVRAVSCAGGDVTEVYLLGNTMGVSRADLEGLDGVEEVVRVKERFRLTGRAPGDLSLPGFTYRGVRFDADSFHVFAGVCAVDDRQQVKETFRALSALGVVTTRAGAYKPRTSPYDFQGRGRDCLPWVFELAGEYGIQVIAMEVTREEHIEDIREALARAGQPTGVMLQIGTRNAQNFELLKAVGRQREFPVLYKRGMGLTLEESFHAVEYIASAGNDRIVFCLRGVRSHLGEPHRNFVDFAHVPAVTRLTRLPVCIDPSHAVGMKSRGADGLLDIHHATAQGIVAGAHMVLVDVHPRPEDALCDGPQALTLDELPHYLADCALVRRCYEQRRALQQRIVDDGNAALRPPRAPM